MQWCWKNCIKNTKTFLEKNENIGNHLIVDEFNVDILNTDEYVDEFLANFFEYKFKPTFTSITRSNNGGGGSCIHNICMKSHNVNYQNHKLIYKMIDHSLILGNIDLAIHANINGNSTANCVNTKRVLFERSKKTGI